MLIWGTSLVVNNISLFRWTHVCRMDLLLEWSWRWLWRQTLKATGSPPSSPPVSSCCFSATMATARTAGPTSGVTSGRPTSTPLGGVSRIRRPLKPRKVIRCLLARRDTVLLCAQPWGFPSSACVGFPNCLGLAFWMKMLIRNNAHFPIFKNYFGGFVKPWFFMTLLGSISCVSSCKTVRLFEFGTCRSVCLEVVRPDCCAVDSLLILLSCLFSPLSDLGPVSS